MDKWQRAAQASNRRAARIVTAIMLVVVAIMGGIAIAHMDDKPVDDPPAQQNVLGGP